MQQHSAGVGERPRFELKEIYSEGTESAGIYSLREFAERFEDISMGRRGFLKLSLFLQMVMTVKTAVPGISYAESGSPTGEPLLSVGGKIISIEAESPEMSTICLEIDEALMGGLQRHDSRDLEVGDIVNVSIQKAEDSLSVLGRITRIDLIRKTICTAVSLDTGATAEDAGRPSGSKEDQGPLLGAGVYLHSVDFKITDIKELHLKSGGIIHSGSVWIEKERFCFYRGRGIIGVPIKNVNVLKSLTETFRKESTGEAFVKVPIYGKRKKIGRHKPSRSRNICICVPVCTCVPVYR